MQIVINVSEEIMEYVKNNGCLSVIYNDEVAKAISSGMPYEERPKGECCGSCYLCDVGDCGADMRKEKEA